MSHKVEETKYYDGLPVSQSSVQRLTRELKQLEEKVGFKSKQYDTLKIKCLTQMGSESDPTRSKADQTAMDQYKAAIKKKEKQLLNIRLLLK